MSDTTELDRCRADLYRAKTRLANAQHRIADLESKLAAAEAEIDRLKTEDAVKDDAMLELEGKLATFGDCEDYGTDKHAATRRAIVRAAAAMGVASEDS